MTTHVSDDDKTLAHCESSIKELFADHVNSPLCNMREEDFRASLLGKLRDAFKDSVPVVPVILFTKQGDSVVDANDECLTTNRVHAEVAVTESGKAVFDLIVFRDGPVRFTVNHGLTDVLKTVSVSDVAVAIEIKAAPTNGSRVMERIKNDIKKLKALHRRAPRIRCFLVVIDKALLLGVAKSMSNHDQECVEKLQRFLMKRRGQIEMWYLGGDPISAAVVKEGLA